MGWDCVLRRWWRRRGRERAGQRTVPGLPRPSKPQIMNPSRAELQASVQPVFTVSRTTPRATSRSNFRSAADVAAGAIPATTRSWL